MSNASDLHFYMLPLSFSADQKLQNLDTRVFWQVNGGRISLSMSASIVISVVYCPHRSCADTKRSFVGAEFHKSTMSFSLKENTNWREEIKRAPESIGQKRLCLNDFHYIGNLEESKWFWSMKISGEETE